jgi:hypothetical protein
MTWLLGAFNVAKGFFSGIWGYVAVGASALVAILVALSKAKKAGIDEVVVKTKEKEVENVKKANEVEREIVRTKSSEKRSNLLDKWSRD